MWITNPKTGRTIAKKCRRRFTLKHSPRELTFSCYRGNKFLARDRTCQWFVDAMSEGRDRFLVDLWAWVLMPEHVHLIVVPRESAAAVVGFQRFVKEKVARKAIRWLEENSPAWIPRITVREGVRTRRRFWQPGGGYDRNVDDLTSLQYMIAYFHLNPVRRGLVEKAVDWAWSSARWYAGVRPAIIEMDRSLPMLKEGGTT